MNVLDTRFSRNVNVRLRKLRAETAPILVHVVRIAQGSFDAIASALRARCVLPVLYLLAGTFAESWATGMEFEVDSEIRWKLINPRTQAVSSEYKAKATIYYRDCSWLMRITDNELTVHADYWELGSDGNRVYELHSNQSFINAAREQGKTNLAQGWVAIIAPGPMPEVTLGNHQVSVLWLAYMSHCYLSSVTNSYVLPMFESDDRRSALVKSGKYLQKAHWEFSNIAPNVTRKITFLGDYIPYTSSENLPQSGSVQHPGIGLTNAIFECFETTNFAGRTLPLSYALAKLVLAQEGDNVVIRTNALVEGTTLAVRPKCMIASFLPRIPQGIKVSDKRFSRDGGPRSVIYAVQDKWLPDNEAMAQPSYAARLEDQRRVETLMNRRNVTPTALTLVMLGILLAAGGFLFWLMTRQVKQ